MLDLYVRHLDFMKHQPFYAKTLIGIVNYCNLEQINLSDCYTSIQKVFWFSRSIAIIRKNLLENEI